MRSHYLRFLLCLFIGVTLTITPVSPQVWAQEELLPRLEPTDCWMELPDGVVEGDNIVCGYLIVPEDRSDPSSSTIQLAYAVLSASSDEQDVQPDPVIYLAGGPGGNAVGTIADWVEAPYLQDRDFILLDQRGTGYSQPSLNCPEAEQEEENATQLCYDRLISEGINLQAYNSVENAADVADLRVALGYDEWNLFGISYGTRLALTVMRDHPDGVRSVVIDSVYPPEISSWEEYGVNTADVFTRLFEACANDEQCNSAYPDLDQVFERTVADLNSNPASYTGTNSDSGDFEDKQMSGNDFNERLFQLLYSSKNIPYLPKVISAVANGEYTALDQLESGEMVEAGRRQAPDEGVSDSEGMNLSVECQEEVAFLDEATSIANVPAEPAALYDRSVGSIQATFRDCQIWGVEPANEIETQPVESDIPTLVVAGEFDPITPAKWAESAASYLPNSFFYLFPGGGHGVIDLNDCSKGIMQAFLNDPTQEPDASCIDDIGNVQWALPE